VDRKALPAPEGRPEGMEEYVAPRTPTEEVLAGIWAELLHLEQVGRHDDFFGLGGHSLVAMRVIERMRRIGLHIDVRALFVNPTLAGLAATVSGDVGLIEIPENRIPEKCESITPEMLPLVKMTKEGLEAIVKRVPGGAANVQDIYPLAPLQEGILFHHLMEGKGDPYLVASQVRFDSRARLDSYLESMQAVIDRHDILRTAVIWEGLEEPVQVVWRKAALQVEDVELDPMGGDVGEQLYACFDPRQHRIDVRQAPLIRVAITHDKENGTWLMMLLIHHLAGDHTTLEVMQAEIQAYLLGHTDLLPAPVPFRNLVAQSRLGVSKEEHETFFRGMLGDVEEATAPFGMLEVQGDGTGIEEAQIWLDRKLSERIRQGARKLGVTAASLCHVAWARVLASVSGCHDVVFGTVLFGRMHGGMGSDQVMGLAINTLPVRIHIGEENVEASVRRTHHLLAQLLRHEHASLVLAQRCSGVAAPTPLFSALLNYRHSQSGAQSLSEEVKQAWEGMKWVRGEERSNYPFTLTVDDVGEAYGLTAHVQGGINPKRVCEFMRTSLESLVGALESAPGTAVRSLEVLPEAERRQVLHEWNETTSEFPTQQCIHELFEALVGKTPEAVAVVHKDASLTYAELNRQANRLAHHLRGLGVKPDARVGICMERGLEMMVGLLAVLKAGGAYLPLDPAYPVERLQFMLQDGAPTVLLTQRHLKEMLIGVSEAVPVLDLTEVDPAWQDQPEENPSLAGLTPKNLAYVIYTSGSTGTPKGVLIEHGGVVNVITASITKLGVDEGSRVLQLASLSFDASVLEIFTAWLSGAALYLVERELFLSGETLGRFLSANAVTTMVMPPSLLELIPVADYPALRSILVGGETCSAEHAAGWCAGRLFFNAYAPTEATIYATAMLCSAGERQRPSIGRPIANMRVYILDAHQEPVPVGATGELYIGGVGVARGYLNRPELTAERFLQDPFADEADARMYKTGDLGRWLPDGTIEFLGRNDFQIKIRGFRIELGEIEARLIEHGGVREAVVVPREDVPGEKRLVGYVVFRTSGEVGTVRTYLKQWLPEYMVPSALVVLDKLPLTANGKVDRKALPAPEGRPEGMEEYVAPRTPTEEVLAGIWAEVLRVERVGIHEDFFELGGHSLLATRVITRVREKLKIELPLRAMFESPTVMELAERSEEARRTGQGPVLPPLTPYRKVRAFVGGGAQ
jgi:amino acid adenylation domain-containing protein